MHYLYSIVIPSYNVENYLQRTLDSVFAQSYSNLEIIVVNDGSTDRTEDIIQANLSKDKRIKLVSKSNGGISSARNAGIHNATGQYISFLDADDTITNDFVENMITVLQDSNSVYCGNQHIVKDNVKKQVNNDFRTENVFSGFLSNQTLFHIGCLGLRLEFLLSNDIFFDECLVTGEDMNFIAKILCLSDIKPVSKFLYNYYYREDSIMNKEWFIKNYLDDIRAWESIHIVASEIYTKNDKEIVIAKINSKILYYKLRLLWFSILSGKYDETLALLDNNFLNYTESDLDYVEKKYKGFRRTVIESKNVFLWKLIKSISRKKYNLS